MNQNNLLLTMEEQVAMAPAFDEHLLFALERRYLDFLDVEHLELAMNPARDAYHYPSHLRMLRIDELAYQGDAQHGLHLLNMQNVLSAMKDDSHSVIAVVNSDGGKAGLYYGLSRRLGASNQVSTHEYARVLAQAIKGNFLGAKISPLDADAIYAEVMAPMLAHENILSFPGIPSLRLKDPNGPYVQGIDRFIEGMRGESYSLAIVAEPVTLPDIDGMIKNLFDLGTSVHSSVRATIQKMKGSSDTVNVGMFGMKGISEGTTTGETTTEADTTSQTMSRMGLGGLMMAAGPLLGTAGAVVGSFVPGIGTMIGGAVGAAVGSAAGTLGAYGSAAPLTAADAASQAHSFTRSVAHTAGDMAGGGGFGGYARTWNRSTAATQEVLNKTAEHCEKLTDAYIARLQGGKNLGFWNVGVYFLAKKRYTQLRGEGLLRSAFSGDETYWEPVRCVSVNADALGQYLINFANPRYNLFLRGEEKRRVEKAVGFGARLRALAEKKRQSVETILTAFRKADETARRDLLEAIRQQPADYGPADMERAWAQIRAAQLGHPLGPALAGVSTPLNTEELSIIMNFPREEVQGVTIRESAAFGVNYQQDETDVASASETITIGHVMHKGEALDRDPFRMRTEHLSRHGFVCGLTGSGKTNTCMNILGQLHVPFLVIEPAKSEYRRLLNIRSDIQVFTLGNETVSPFRINPFEFAPGVQLLTHIDHLKTVFNAAFPMYASMPYLLEEALTEIYMDKGWVLATSENRYFDVHATEDVSDYLPTLEDLLRRIDAVVASKNYAQQLSMDLTAALKARLSSLLTGSKGLMLNTQRSTPFKEILKNNVVLELNAIGDDDEKCFLMGLVLTLLYEHQQTAQADGGHLRHLTLIEEAHRLLKRVPEYASVETANVRGKAVETFSNLISEIREYGEGILIADQIPSKMAADVIKNTNLKIVHRTLSLDDREMVGAAMTLNEAQGRELPLLQAGQAVVHREGLVKPFMIKVPLVKDGRAAPVPDDHLKTAMTGFHQRHSDVFRRLPGFEKDPAIPKKFLEMDFRKFDGRVYECVIAAALMFAAAESQAVSPVREKVASVLEKLSGETDGIVQSCQIIWYANWFFAKVNQAYGRYDKCLHAQTQFINLWFQEVHEQTQLEAFRNIMTEIPGSRSPFEPMLSWYVKKSDAARKLTQMLNSPDWNENYPKLNDFLTSSVQNATFSIQLAPKTTNDLKISMLRLVLKGNPFAEAIVRIYSSKFIGD